LRSDRNILGLLRSPTGASSLATVLCISSLRHLAAKFFSARKRLKHRVFTTTGKTGKAKPSPSGLHSRENSA
jgi:hypothetical protein